jgi:hypothetical protein
MRTGLPTDFLAQSGAAANRPVNLLVLKFAGALGWVYLSDRDLGSEDGLSHEYVGLVRDWGQISDLPVNVLDATGVAETRDMSITLWNGGAQPFSERFLEQDPENVEAELWQWFEGTPETSAVLIDRFTVADPIAYDEASRELRLDLVSISITVDCQVGQVIEAEDFPDAPAASIGQVVPTVFGLVPGVPCPCIEAPAECQLAASILRTERVVAVDDASKFPDSGVIQIDDERMLYLSRTAAAFNVAARGHQGTVKTDHLTGRTVAEVRSYVFAASKGPVKGIDVDKVRVDGLKPDNPPTISLGTDPATITFDGPPKATALAEGTSWVELQMDAVVDGGSAVNPELAFDDENANTAAELSRDHPLLQLKQTTANADRGAIRKATVMAEHYEDGQFAQDHVAVEVSDGQGWKLLGRLSKPHLEDQTTVTAEVDIVHAHSNNFQAEHTHTLTSPSNSLTDPGHTHNLGTSDVEYSAATIDTNQPTPFKKVWSDRYGKEVWDISGGHATVTFSLPGTPPTGSWRLQVKYKGEFYVGWPGKVVWPGLDPTRPLQLGTLYADGGYGSAERLPVLPNCAALDAELTATFPLPGPEATIYLSCVQTLCISWNTWTTLNGSIIEVKLICTPDSGGVEAATTQVHLTQTSPGNNATVQPLTGQVDPLATDNVPLQNVQVSGPTRTTVDAFDLTGLVAGDWGWFTGREVRLSYLGPLDGLTCYVRHVWFEAEFAPREVKLASVVTADVEGIIDDAAGSITGTPRRQITRPDDVRRWLLVRQAGLDASRCDFGRAGTRYNELGYHFDLALTEQMSLKDLERKLARQCRSRFYWDAGVARIAVRERDASVRPAKDVTADMILLDSMHAERGRVANLGNKISLFYRKDLGSAESGSKGFLASVRGQNDASVAAHGEKERPDDFLFDAVRDDAMAADLRDFYLEHEGRISTFYTFDCFLDAFDLEKEDGVRLYHPFDTLAGNIAVVWAAGRILGSGEGRQADLVRVQAELLPRKRLRLNLSDETRARDALSRHFLLTPHLAELAHTRDALRFDLALSKAEGVAALDDLSRLVNIDRLHSEALAAADALRADLSLSKAEAIRCEDVAEASVGDQDRAALTDETGSSDRLAVTMQYGRTLQEAVHATDSLTIQILSGYGRTPYGNRYGR